MHFLAGVFVCVATVSAWGTPIAEVNLGSKKYNVNKISENHGIVWGLDFLDNETLIFTEKTGNLNTFSLKTSKAKVLKNPPKSVVHGQGGLLDVAVHPKFSKTKKVYVTYTKSINNQFTLAAAWAELQNGAFGPWNEFFVAQTANKNMEHFGSRLVFDGKGHIFISAGERGERQSAQKLSEHTGKIIRLKEDGSVPKDNPFIKTANAKPEIWSYGHRNPQGMYYDLSTSTLYAMEHGPQGGDEINIVKKGANYGWPVITYGKEYGSGSDIGEGTQKNGMEQPYKHFVPSIAPSGLVIYKGSKLPDFKEYIISGSLVLTHLNLVKKLEKEFCEVRLLKDVGDRIRDVIQGPDELLYFSTDSGKILRIEPGETLASADKSACPKAAEKLL